jgi:hypothetical protein
MLPVRVRKTLLCLPFLVLGGARICMSDPALHRWSSLVSLLHTRHGGMWLSFSSMLFLGYASIHCGLYLDG